MSRLQRDPPTYPRTAGGVLGRKVPRVAYVAALLVTSNGRYLMQLRDGRPKRVPHHWALFGGGIARGETPREALLRELDEELALRPKKIHWFTEMTYVLPQIGHPPVVKVFFEVPIEPKSLPLDHPREGAGMRFFSHHQLTRQPLVVPWDAYGIFLHARRRSALVLHSS